MGLMRTVSNNWLKIISLNVQSVFFNRVGHWCAEGRREFVGKNFVGRVEQTVESGTDQGTDVFAILIKEVSLNLSSFSYILLLLIGVRNITCYTDYKS